MPEDVEKQGFDASTTQSSSSHPSDEVNTPNEHHITNAASLSYQAAVGEEPDQEKRMTVKRTFSRRTEEDIDAGAHLFGGDLTRTRTELEAEEQVKTKGQEEDPVILVHWEGDDDPENPQNFGFYYKIYITVLGAIIILNSTFTSSAPTGIIESQIAYFGFSQEVATLTISLWVAGYCLGPLIWGPLSERVGRMPVFLISIFMYTVWNVACALSKTTAQILVFRFLGGAFGAAPLTNSGGIIADVWGAKHRGIAMTLFAVAPSAGPALGPLVSGAIQVTGTTWRWVYYTCALFSGTMFVLCVFTARETYAPIILKRKAKRIRKETGNEAYKAPLELTPLRAKTLLHDTLLFPFVMLVQEPILLSLGVYFAFIYGLIYLLFGAYPIIFEEIHGFNALIGGVMFLPIFVGSIVGSIVYIVFFNPRYARKMVECQEQGIARVPPEERLKIVCLAAPCLVISFFWLGWTSFDSISFWCPMMSGGLFGFSTLLIFVGLFNYTIDAYLSKAASALAGSTVLRSGFGAGFPLFTDQMFRRLSVKWACTLLGGIALLMLPIPFVLYKYGPKIRSWSKHAAA